MKKHVLFCVLFSVLFFSLNTHNVFAGKGSGVADNSGGGFSNTQDAHRTVEYFPDTKIIKGNNSFIKPAATKVVISLDFSDDAPYNVEGKKIHLKVVDTKTNLEEASAEAVLNADKIIITEMSGLNPNTNYTLFIMPYLTATTWTPRYTIAFKTNDTDLAMKSFNYAKTSSSEKKQNIILTITYESVPDESNMLFSITSTDPSKDQKNIPPDDVGYVSQSTTYSKTFTDLDLATKFTATAVLMSKENKVLDTQIKDTPDTIDGSAPGNGNVDVGNSYQFLTNLPGLNVLCEVKNNNGDCVKYKEGDFGDYLKVLIRLTYGLIALIAVFQIIYYGVTYMLTATPFMKTTSKERIYNAIMGIVIALGSYLILYTINPNLVSINLNGPKIAIQNKNPSLFSIIGQSQIDMYNKLGGVDFKPTKYYAQIKTFVNNHNYDGYPDKVPACVIQAAIQRESGGDPNVVGHDENAPYTSIPSRSVFVNSGKKGSGATFTTDSSLITKTDFLNDDNGSTLYTAKNPNASDLGLDWRFSHGVGLGQITFFPTGSKDGPNWDKGVDYPITTSKHATPKDMLDPDKAIEFSVEKFQVDYKTCGKNIMNTYKRYASGDCNSTNQFAVTEAGIRSRMYDQCVAQDK